LLALCEAIAVLKGLFTDSEFENRTSRIRLSVFRSAIELYIIVYILNGIRVGFLLVNSALIKSLEFEGNSRSVLKSFPREVRQDMGENLRRLQKGFEPLHFIYYTKVKTVIYVLHAFEKESAKTSKRDIRTAEQRLAALKARLRKEGILK
jgi:phage-related protein